MPCMVNNRRSMDGQNTDAIIDRIFWGLTNVCDKAQIAMLMKHFTVQKLNPRTKMLESVVRPELETGRRYKPQSRIVHGRLFGDEPLGDMPMRGIMDRFTLIDVILIMFKTFDLPCDRDEAVNLALVIDTAYAKGHAGQQSDILDDEDERAGGTVEDGMNNNRVTT